MSKYVIINEEAIQKKIEEWEAEWRKCFEAPVGEFNHDYAIKLQQAIDTAREFLSQSTPLIPEIEKAFDAGREQVWTDINQEEKDFVNDKQDYISNLKLDI